MRQSASVTYRYHYRLRCGAVRCVQCEKMKSYDELHCIAQVFLSRTHSLSLSALDSDSFLSVSVSLFLCLCLSVPPSRAVESVIVLKMLFFSFFKTLVNEQVQVELRNGVILKGTLTSVVQYLNVKLNNIIVYEGVKYPQLGALKNCFIRGSVIRCEMSYCSN